MEIHNAAEILPKLALQKRQEKESENTYTCLITDTFGCYLWKVIATRSPKIHAMQGFIQDFFLGGNVCVRESWSAVASVFLKVTSLGLLKWKERPGYAVDGTRQFMGTNFHHQRKSGMSKLHSVLILNCTGIPGCLCHQVTSFAVVTINIIIIFSLSIYHCHESLHALVVV